MCEVDVFVVAGAAEPVGLLDTADTVAISTPTWGCTAPP
jgi:hypothetical protein